MLFSRVDVIYSKSRRSSCFFRLLGSIPRGPMTVAKYWSAPRYTQVLLAGLDILWSYLLYLQFYCILGLQYHWSKLDFSFSQLIILLKIYCFSTKSGSQIILHFFKKGNVLYKAFYLSNSPIICYILQGNSAGRKSPSGDKTLPGENSSFWSTQTCTNAQICLHLCWWMKPRKKVGYNALWHCWSCLPIFDKIKQGEIEFCSILSECSFHLNPYPHFPCNKARMYMVPILTPLTLNYCFNNSSCYCCRVWEIPNWIILLS